MRGKAAILFAQAIRASGQERPGLLREARENFLASESREPGSGAFRAACVSARLGEQDECRKWLEQSTEPGLLLDLGAGPANHDRQPAVRVFDQCDAVLLQMLAAPR